MHAAHQSHAELSFVHPWKPVSNSAIDARCVGQPEIDMNRRPTTVSTIDLDRDQMIVLSAGQDAPLSAFYGALWLGVGRPSDRPQRFDRSVVAPAVPYSRDGGDGSPPAGRKTGPSRTTLLSSLRMALRPWQQSLQRFVQRQQLGPVGAAAEF